MFMYMLCPGVTKVFLISSRHVTFKSYVKPKVNVHFSVFTTCVSEKKSGTFNNDQVMSYLR